MKILLIEDETALRENVSEMLELEGFEVYSAVDGRDGVEIALRVHPDLIVCDIAMPEMDGYQVLKTLRAYEATLATPFIFLTARTDRSDVRQGMQLGADDYITKPFSHKELMEAIHARLTRRQALDEQAKRDVERIKRELTQMVSHELRTPLVSITMVQEYISSQLDQLSREELVDLLNILRGGSQRLSHLVEQMVMFTQLQTGILDRERVHKNAVLTDSWTLVVAGINLGRRFAYRNPNLSIQAQEYAPGARVLCHPPTISHAIGELIANALDFSAEGQTINVYQWLDGQTVWVQVVDQGAGMPGERLEDALKPFVQINRERQEQQGMGLGLPLAKMVVEAHGGQLYLESALGQGTKASLSLPLAEQT
ncbi:MAG: response regulator [Anaerolineae bacterium]|nr:response regulator [Anaerolineae bacterium]MDW8173679.1 response regulator [Anaerolineae bacterium]